MKSRRSPSTVRRAAIRTLIGLGIFIHSGRGQRSVLPGESDSSEDGPFHVVCSIEGPRCSQYFIPVYDPRLLDECSRHRELMTFCTDENCRVCR